MGCDFKRLEVDDDDVVVGRAGDEGAGAVGLHQDSGGAVADGDALDFFARGRVEDDEVAAAEDGDEDQFAVEGELEAVGAERLWHRRVSIDLFCGEVDDGDVAVLGVGGPELLAIGRDSKPSEPRRRG